LADKSTTTTNKERGKKQVDLIMKSAERAADLTFKLLTFGRKAESSSSLVNIYSILDDIISILASTVDKKIKISIEKNAENYIIFGDNSAIQNALLNIAINASHAMPDGGHICISTDNIQLNKTYCKASPFAIEAGEFIDIEIQDTGCGISQENIHKIFEPFYTSKEWGKGTGLGLAAVYGTVKEHNGAIMVDSKVNVGTSFHILLPCSDKVFNNKPENKELVTGTGKILLVDDEHVIRITGEAMLKEMGYQVILAENGLEALEIFKEKHSEIDLVIMDLIMPEMSGGEAFSKMLKIDKDSIILLSSGLGENQQMKELKESGLAGFIRKPYRDFKLSQLLSELLNS